AVGGPGSRRAGTGRRHVSPDLVPPQRDRSDPRDAGPEVLPAARLELAVRGRGGRVHSSEGHPSMTTLDRRTFIGTLGAALLAVRRTMAASISRPGVQLYTVRTELQKNFHRPLP